jgi:hypothetical protein
MNMHKYLVYTTYGWLAATGSLHFIVDVLSQWLRGKREPSVETTLYYGLNSAFALGQVAFGVLGIFVAWRAMHVLTQMPALILSLAAAFGWLAITFLFMDYWEPKFNAGVFFALIAGVLVAR